MAADEHPRIDVFFVLGDGAPREEVARWLAALRARGVAADTDYAARSVKGQLTQAGRLGAESVVVVDTERATLRRSGSEDEEIAHADVVGRLSP